MPANKYLEQSGGLPAERRATQTSAGAADGGKILALGDDGRLDLTVMPDGISADTATITTSEALAAGDFVNIWTSSGTKVRKADASGGLGKRAHGFVKAAVSSGAQAIVYFEGRNTGLTAQTVGDVFLSSTVPGQATNTVPTTGGHIAQVLGLAVSATEVNVEIDSPILLAA